MKRDDRTPPNRRRFVVLEHRWAGVHWDFMVELVPGAALRTWAIDGLPLEGVELPARGLPDHRREYLDFEGAISGGRGTVRRWDEGTCEVEVWEPGHVALVLAGRHLTGPAELVLSTAAGGSVGSGSASTAGGGSGPSWTFRLGKLS
jgi:hypothetical protein